MDQREITRTAAEVANQNQLIVFKSGLVVVSRGNRLQLKLHRIKSRNAKSVPQPPFSILIVLVIRSADKLYRPTHHRGTHRNAELLFREALQVFQNAGDKFFQRSSPGLKLP